MAPRFPVDGLRSVHLVVPDLAAALRFYTEVWGLIDVATQDGTHYLRGIGEDAYLVALSAGPQAAIAEVTWHADPAADLAALHARMIAAGAAPDQPVGPRRDFGGGTGFSVFDPAGRRIGVAQGDARPARLENDAYRPVRLAHVNLNTDDVQRDIAFHRDGMGMVLTDLSAAMGFLRCNDDHHAIVLAKGTVNTLNHVSFLHDHYDDMMRAGGKMCDAGHAIGWGPGRHGPGDNVFFYFVDPFGIVIEHTAEVEQVDDSYPVGGPDDWIWPEGRVDKWGICPPKTDECKAAQLAVPFVR
ncbi:Manganese-dependent 2,3-dihydroxybiphenyl 1,2-dioxygenase [Aquimixticola soesokkakensis]|uniref:Manganese-dependent 2,3-dihydroxybiphenyl 1,2-dioxygenase n=1 Tax=Aquimixticola soesokkakensis TaxID=1519096 RepID=A0A1Y5TBX9_9RHOB|nr:VOC family protein [Aquimixticola soesokkakensis]SLN60162.1 Manganese-dependent 2,3-dihydroxybiphenyl 1,2-dioxygenase [Aquimixticola soesokkakensis]